MSLSLVWWFSHSFSYKLIIIIKSADYLRNEVINCLVSKLSEK